MTTSAQASAQPAKFDGLRRDVDAQRAHPVLRQGCAEPARAAPNVESGSGAVPQQDVIGNAGRFQPATHARPHDLARVVDRTQPSAGQRPCVDLHRIRRVSLVVSPPMFIPLPVL